MPLFAMCIRCVAPKQMTAHAVLQKPCALSSAPRHVAPFGATGRAGLRPYMHLQTVAIRIIFGLVACIAAHRGSYDPMPFAIQTGAQPCRGKHRFPGRFLLLARLSDAPCPSLKRLRRYSSSSCSLSKRSSSQLSVMDSKRSSSASNSSSSLTATGTLAALLRRALPSCVSLTYTLRSSA